MSFLEPKEKKKKRIGWNKEDDLLVSGQQLPKEVTPT